MKPSKIYTLGDYYKDNLKDLCHYIKRDVPKVLIKLIINEFIDEIPENSLLIPMPSYHPFPFTLCSELVKTRSDLISEDIFNDAGITSMYNRKKYIEKTYHRRIQLSDSRLFLCRPFKEQYKERNIVLIDDVIGTGCTMAKAMALLKKQCQAMCLAVDWETFNSYDWNE